jgi:hypothetical protein
MATGELVQDVSGNGFSTASYAGLPTSALDPRFGQIIALNNQGWSNYHGLVSSFKWRMNRQLSGQFFYTWSHCARHVKPVRGCQLSLSYG